MAFSNTAIDVIPIADGYVMEYGTFSGAGVTTGIITAATTGTFTAGAVLYEIVKWGFASDGDTAILPARDTAVNAIKITFTSADSGDYWIEGKAL